MHLAIAGNIGSGKTTLTGLLSRHYGWDALYESVDFNPYLSDFYADMKRWSFSVQIYFLNRRFTDLLSILRSGANVIHDRTIFEDAQIFAANLHDMGLMDSRDYDNYVTLFNIMMSLVKKPDLVIYLRSSVPNLVTNIQKRGREYENSIRLDYLTNLNERYDKWIESYTDPKIILDVDELRFEERPEDLAKVISMIDGALK